jgi:hypothetical protein
MPEGFKSITEELPPLWEDVLLITEDNRRIIGYYAGNKRGENEFCTTNDDECIKNVVGWLPML